MRMLDDGLIAELGPHAPFIASKLLPIKLVGFDFVDGASAAVADLGIAPGVRSRAPAS
jgi:hypothetical protein